MYTVEFYEKANGESELWDFLESLRKKASTDKNSRIQYKQISLYIQLLQDNGTRLSENITKHIDDDIWELRPGNNRVFYFSLKMILLFCFIILKRNHKKRRDVRLKKRNPNAMTICQERKYIMRTWNDYKEHVKSIDAESKKAIEEVEALSSIITAVASQRNALGISQRELASMCGIPQSSVARIESFKTTPNLDTLLKIMQPLGLKLTVSHLE